MARLMQWIRAHLWFSHPPPLAEDDAPETREALAMVRENLEQTMTKRPELARDLAPQVAELRELEQAARMRMAHVDEEIIELTIEAERRKRGAA